MIYLKSCNRCSGDVVLEKDWFGAYSSCLACGHMTYPEEQAAHQAPVAVPSATWPATVRRLDRPERATA